MTFIDTHAHYDDKAFEADLPQVLEKAAAAGCEAIINCACETKSIKTTLKIAKEHKLVYAALGYHPEDLKGMEYENIDYLYDRATSSERVKAIGEIGLDYHWMAVPREEQQDWFVEQIELAKELELPVIIHSRDAAEDTYNILKDARIDYCGGVIHGFSGAKEMAERYLKLGLYLGLGGVCTFSNARKIVEAIPSIPLDRILLETDCPYLTPVPHRGERNDSSMIVHVIDFIAQLKGITPEEVAEVTTQNAKRLFRIK